MRRWEAISLRAVNFAAGLRQEDRGPTLRDEPHIHAFGQLRGRVYVRYGQLAMPLVCLGFKAQCSGCSWRVERSQPAPRGFLPTYSLSLELPRLPKPGFKKDCDLIGFNDFATTGTGQDRNDNKADAWRASDRFVSTACVPVSALPPAQSLATRPAATEWFVSTRRLGSEREPRWRHQDDQLFSENRPSPTPR